MTLKKSSADTFFFTFLYTIKKSIWLPLILFVYGIVHHIGAIISVATETDENVWIRSDNVKYIFSSDSFDMPALFLTALFVLVPVGLAVLNFRYMMNKSSVNVYYSLGITRSNMFLSKFSAGCIMLIAAVSVPLVVAALLNCALFGSSAEMWINFVFILLNYIAFVLIIYSATVLMFSLLGSIFESLVMAAVFLVAPYAILLVVEFLLSTFLLGSPYTNVPWAPTANNIVVIGEEYVDGFIPFYAIEPFFFFLLSAPYQDSVVGYKENPVETPDFTGVIIYLAAAILISLLAWIAYKKKKAEITGFMGSNKFVTSFAVFIISSFISSYVIPGIFTIKSNFVHILIGAAVFAFVYLFINTISLRNFKKIIKGLWKLPVLFGIYLVGILIFVTGFFGYTTRLPEIEKIKSVSIETETGDILLNSSSANYYGFYYFDSSVDFMPTILLADELYEHTAVGGFTSKEDIARAVDIHKKLIDSAKINVSDESVLASHNERIVPVSISIVYHLDDGSEFKRAYYTADNEILSQLAEFTKTERYKQLAIDYLSQNNSDENNYTNSTVLRSATISLASPNLSSFTYSPEYNGDIPLSAAVLENLGKDIENGTFSLDYRNNSELIGYISFKDIVSEIGDGSYSAHVTEDGTWAVQTEDTVYELKQDFDINSAIDSYLLQSESGITIPVYANMVNTVSFMEENGLMKYFENKQSATELRLWEYGNGSMTDNWILKGSTTLFNGMWHNGWVDSVYVGNELPSLPDGYTTVENPAQIAEYEEKARMVYLTCYDGYYAQFIYPDGSMTFAYIPK